MNKQYAIYFFGKNLHVGSYPSDEAAEPHVKIAKRHRTAIMQRKRCLKTRLKELMSNSRGPTAQQEHDRLLHEYNNLQQTAIHFMKWQQRKEWPDDPTPEMTNMPWFPPYTPPAPDPSLGTSQRYSCSPTSLFGIDIPIGSYRTTEQRKKLTRLAERHITYVIKAFRALKNSSDFFPEEDTEDFQKQAFAYLDTQRELGWTRTPTFTYKEQPE